MRVNIEANHATLGGHTFEPEIAMAPALDMFGSIDANRGDHQYGWDTDQFPNSVDASLGSIADHAVARAPKPRSGRQEWCANMINRV